MHELRVESRAHLVAVTVTEDGGHPFEIQVKRAPVEVVWPGDGREPEGLTPAQAEAKRFAGAVAEELRAWGDTQHDTRLAAATRNIERALAEGFDFPEGDPEDVRRAHEAQAREGAQSDLVALHSIHTPTSEVEAIIGQWL